MPDPAFGLAETKTVPATPVTVTATVTIDGESKTFHLSGSSNASPSRVAKSLSDSAQAAMKAWASQQAAARQNTARSASGRRAAPGVTRRPAVPVWLFRFILRYLILVVPAAGSDKAFDVGDGAARDGSISVTVAVGSGFSATVTVAATSDANIYTTVHNLAWWVHCDMVNRIDNSAL